MAEITIIARAGKDAHKHSLWEFECSACKSRFVARKDKAACACSKPALIPEQKSTLVIEQPTAVETVTEKSAESPEQGSIAWLKETISAKRRLIANLEQQASEDELVMEHDLIPFSDGMSETVDKRWARILAALVKLRRELSRMVKELTRLEAARSAPQNAQDAYKAKLAALRQSQGQKP